MRTSHILDSSSIRNSDLHQTNDNEEKRNHSKNLASFQVQIYIAANTNKSDQDFKQLLTEASKICVQSGTYQFGTHQLMLQIN